MRPSPRAAGVTSMDIAWSSGADARSGQFPGSVGAFDSASAVGSSGCPRTGAGTWISPSACARPGRGENITHQPTFHEHSKVRTHYRAFWRNCGPGTHNRMSSLVAVHQVVGLRPIFASGFTAVSRAPPDVSGSNPP
ncbi:hypothetical protein HJG60_011994 [Phyllostomus discolor]|uniref:Uncharacterized protein n=1 Tax=Phyllostomus discolor TaxID=89673 RepID=A0A834DW71_9CHIR|nr:hypothetical protein HJG60_011994 [Phyllostomus discolor]